MQRLWDMLNKAVRVFDAGRGCVCPAAVANVSWQMGIPELAPFDCLRQLLLASMFAAGACIATEKQKLRVCAHWPPTADMCAVLILNLVKTGQ